MQMLMTAAIIVGVLLVAILAAGLILSKLYKRASKDLAFVRTGMGGEKVIKDGGGIVLPKLHDATPVNMQTLKLPVQRRNTDALITKDPLRCDVVADFYVRVKPDSENIARAAQTLGNRTQNAEHLRELVESKFVDALRSVAAQLTLQELHEQRQDFVQRVLNASQHDLEKNGLELESVSLTHLDQTDKSHLNPENSFDSKGLRLLAQITEEQRQERNRIEAETRVLIEQQNYEAEQRSLDISRDAQYARLKQQQEVEEQTATQESAIAKRQAEERRASEVARITADQQIDEERIKSERTIALANIAREREIKEGEIAQKRAIESAEIERRQAIELANQGSQIEIAKKSQETAAADAEANTARAEAVKAEELVTTNRETARAERQRAITVINARESAERDAVSITVTAETEKQAAEDRAEAVLTEARANRDRISIEAEAESTRIREVAKAEADAVSAKAAADAEANDVAAKYQKDLNDARNLLKPEQIELIRLEGLYKQLPAIFEAQAKPMENIDSIRILHIPGMGSLSGAPTPNGGDGSVQSFGGGGLGRDVMDLASYYRVQVPLLDEVSKHIRGELDGMHLSKPNGSASPQEQTGSD